MRKNRTSLILWVLLAAFISMIAIPTCNAQKDKVDHFMAGALIGTTATTFTINQTTLTSLYTTLGSVVLIGGGKELVWDKWMGNGVASWEDFGADVVGSLAGWGLVTGFKEIVTSERRGVSKGAKVLGVFVGSILLDAAGDALNDEGEKVWGHTLNALSTGVLLASPFILDMEFRDIGWYIVSYLSLRVALFDPMYNITRGLDPNFIGSTSGWDKALQKLNPPDHMMYFGRAIFLGVGVTIPINEIK